MPKSYYHDGTEWQALLRGEKGGPGPKGDKGDPGPKGDKGDTGAWTTATPIADGVHLNTLTTPGSYRRGSSVGSTTDLGYPTNAWAGWIEVIGSTANNLMQRAVGLFSTISTLRTKHYRTCVDGVWGPWLAEYVDGSLSSRQIWANGRPDIPATTPYTQAQLNSVPIGHEYVSLDRPQGARRWIKTGGSAWQCVEGDTGEVEVPLSLEGYPALSILRARRIGQLVTSTVAANGPISAPVTTDTPLQVGTVPAWACPSHTVTAPVSNAYTHSPTGTTTAVSIRRPTGTVWIRLASLNDRIAASLTYATDATWPITLTI